MTQEYCHFHKEISAEDYCQICEKPICGDCVNFHKTEIYCPEHYKGVRRKKTLTLTIGLLVLIMGLSGGGWFAYQKYIEEENAQKCQEWFKGQEKKCKREKLNRSLSLSKRCGYEIFSRIRSIQDSLGVSFVKIKEPTLAQKPAFCTKPLPPTRHCYSPKASKKPRGKASNKEVCNVLITKELFALVSTQCQIHKPAKKLMYNFLNKCGPNKDIMQLLLQLLWYLGEHDNLISVATRLLKDNPLDVYSYAWRGKAYKKKKEFVKAAIDFRKGIYLSPKATDLPYMLAEVEEKQKNHCQAAKALEHLLYHSPSYVARYLGTDSYVERIKKLHKKGKCFTIGRRRNGTVRIRFLSMTRLPVLRLRINGKSARFALDTGASISVVSAKLARRIGIRVPRHSLRIAVRTISGKLLIVPVVSVALSQRYFKMRSMQVAVLPNEVGSGFEGLLGQNFLSYFRSYQIDNRRKTITLKSR